MSDLADICTGCQGTGWTIRDDGGNRAAVPCECRRPGSNGDVRRQLLARSGMARREIRMGERPWDESAQRKPQWLVDWIDVALLPIDERPDEWRPLVTMLGLPGRGKTMAAAKAAYRYVCRGGRGLVWCNSALAIGQAMRERTMDLVGDGLEQRIRTAQLLVFDDLFAHRVRANWDEAAAEWLMLRERAELPTLITTNLPNLQATMAVDGKQEPRIDARIASRLSGGIVKQMSGPDYRTRKLVPIAMGGAT